MRERAISAAILVPVLLIVIGIGGPVLALAVTLITAIAAVEVFTAICSITARNGIAPKNLKNLERDPFA